MRNLFFLGILVSLLTFTYFSEERSEQESYETKQMQEKLFSVEESGELKSFKSTSFSFKRNDNGNYISQNELPISQEKISLFFNQLYNIKVRRVLENEELQEISHDLLIDRNAPALDFLFERNEIRILMGKKTSFSKRFYMNIINKKRNTKKWVVASYESAYGSAYKEEDAHKSDAPYKQALALFNLPEKTFVDYRVFTNIGRPHKVEVSSLRNRPYTIDLKEFKTSPDVISGITEEKERITNYRELLKKISGIGLYKTGRLSKKIGTIKVDDKKYQFFKELNDENGYFVKTNKFIYQIKASDFRSLFEPQQSFWNKAINIGAAKLFKVIDNEGESIFSSSVNSPSIWTKFLTEEAYYVKEHVGGNFEHNYQINIGSKNLLINSSENGIDILDPKLNVIFHFLEKIK